MGRDDVRRALEAMLDDDVVAARLAEGDVAAVDGLELTTEELALVRDAAADLPDVAGFAFDRPAADHRIPGRLKWGDITLLPSVGPGPFDTALRYGVGDPAAPPTS